MKDSGDLQGICGRKWHDGGDLDHAKRMGLKGRFLNWEANERKPRCLSEMDAIMQISDVEVKKILHSKQLVAEIVEIGKERARAEDEQIVAEVTQAVVQMPDREDRIAELKARIEAGTYQVTGEEIADAMIRRNIADKVS